jgi:hypothetical protein
LLIRKKLLYNAQNKLLKALELIEEYKDQYKFVFSQRIEFLEELSKLLPQDEHRLYHSKMKKRIKLIHLIGLMMEELSVKLYCQLKV